jgi:outer membrane protein W
MQPTKGIAILAVFLAASLIGPAGAEAQYAMGQKYLGVHIGVSGVGSTAALGVNGEISYNDRISIGAWADTWSYGEDYGTVLGNVSWDVRYIAIAGTGSYHFPIESNDKLDPFVGAAVGYFVVSSSTESAFGASYSGDASRLFVGGFGGIRYFFKPRMAGVARVGFGAAYLTLGLDFGF